MMKFKITMLAALAVAMFPFAAQAQDTNSYDSLKVSCESGAECSDFGVNFQEQGEEVAQTRRTRTRRTRRSSSDKKYYIGGTLGVFFSGELDELNVLEDGDIQSIDLGTGFGGGVYGGYKFNDLISGDVEFVIYGGGADPIDDSGYTAIGVFVNPRFTYAINQNSDQSIYVFGSPGIGFTNLSLNDEINDVFSGDTSGGSLAFQLKAGVGYPISESLDIIGQARYINSFQNFEVLTGDGVEDQGFSSFGVEAGVNFKL